MSIFRKKSNTLNDCGDINCASLKRDDNWLEERVRNLEEKLDLLAESQNRYFTRGNKFILNELKTPNGNDVCSKEIG